MNQQDFTERTDCPVDWADLYGRIADEGIITEFAASFLKNSQTLILSLKSPIKTHNPDPIELYAHALKGSASNMGAITLAKAAWPIEKAAAEKQLDNIDELLTACEQAYFALIALLEQPDWISQAKHAAEVKTA